MMNFKQLVGQYVLGNLSADQLIDVAYVGLEEGLESPSLTILAGIDRGENPFVIDKYFKGAIAELSIQMPDRRTATLEYAISIAEDIIDGKVDVFKGVKKIISEAIYIFDFESETIKYAYDGIFFEHVYGLYYTYDDLIGAKNDWSDSKSNEELILEIKEKLFKELKIWLINIRSKDLHS